MQWVSVTHTHRWQAHYHTAGQGPLYQGRFKSFPVQDDLHVRCWCVTSRPTRCGRGWCRGRRTGVGSSLGPRDRAGSGAGLLLSPWPVERPANWAEEVNRPWTESEPGAGAAERQEGAAAGRSGVGGADGEAAGPGDRACGPAGGRGSRTRQNHPEPFLSQATLAGTPAPADQPALEAIVLKALAKRPRGEVPVGRRPGTRHRQLPLRCSDDRRGALGTPGHAWRRRGSPWPSWRRRPAP